MGRGLSDLQRYILDRAGKQRRVYYVEILEGYFGWAPEYEIGRYSLGRYENDHRGEVGELVSPGSQHFSRKRIGEKTYRKVMATLSRSCKRLQARGLVTWLCGTYSYWSGVEITEEGRKWLSVNFLTRCVN